MLSHRYAGAYFIFCIISHVAVMNQSYAKDNILQLQDGLNGYNATQDSYVASGKPGENFGNKASLLADGIDGDNDELVTLIKWELHDLPENLEITAATLKLHIHNRSFGEYKVYAVMQPWLEPAVTWYDLNFSENQQIEIATFHPRTKGPYEISLNGAGISLVQAWVNGDVTNHGLMIRAADTRDGVDFRSSEYSHIDKRPMLEITYQ